MPIIWDITIYSILIKLKSQNIGHKQY